MAKVLEPAVAPNAIVFELERFERADGRLALRGRWFGVRGRRFVRPTLTSDLESGRVRALADLDDKPWAAEDGELWTASFPWDSEGGPEVSEMSVAPDITIQLPAPRRGRGRTERLPAVPRREAMTASWAHVVTSADAERGPQDPARAEPPVATDLDEAGPPSPRDGPQPPDPRPEGGSRSPRDEAEPPDPPSTEPEPAVLAAEVESLRTQLAEAAESLAGSDTERETMRRELSSLRAELEDARAQLSRRSQGFEDAQTELSAARAAREAALRSAARAESEREAALTQAAQAEAEREALAAGQASLRAALEQTQASLGMLSRERDEAVASRGAALVMRGATRALPAHERHVGWLRRSLVLLVLIGVIFAALIVLHAL